MRSLLMAIALGASRMFAQTTDVPVEHTTRERSYDVLHYKLNITIDEKAKTCTGEATIRLVPLRSLLGVVHLDANGLKVSTVKRGIHELDYTLAGDSLLIRLDKIYGLQDTITLAIEYSTATTSKGLYYRDADSGYAKRQSQVWSHGEPEENRYWIPCYDYPNDMATSEMVVTVNERWTAISNGKLLGVKRDPEKHTATFHWLQSKPHTSYLISLVAGEYIEVKDTAGTVPLSYYVYKHQKGDVQRSFGKTRNVMQFFESIIGVPYPWEKYSQVVVQDYVVGGQENVSATTLSDRIIHDARAHLDYNNDGLVAHELAHQWYGDLVTCRDWSHLWLNEGFASYFDILYQEHDKGVDVAARSLQLSRESITSSDVGSQRKATVTGRYIRPNEMFSNRVYGKGAAVLHMLRFILGEELFFKAIRHYTSKFAHQLVETNDLKIAIEEATGFNLHWFFDQWVYKPGYPELDVVSTFNQQTRTVDVTIVQSQELDSLMDLFTMPVDIEVWVNGVSETYRITISQLAETFSFPAYQEPQLVVVDKGNQLLKKIRFSKSAAAWSFQLEHAGAGVDRLIAVDSLKSSIGEDTVVSSLQRAMLSDRFIEVRKKAASVLGTAKGETVVENLILAYGDREAGVRAAAIESMKFFSDERALKTLQHAFTNDSSYAVATAALISLVKTDSGNAKVYCSAALQRDSYREGLRLAALRALAAIGDEEALGLIKPFTSYGQEQSVRIEAIRQLGRVWKKKEVIVSHLVPIMRDRSLPVRSVVVEVLGASGNEDVIDPLRHFIETSSDTLMIGKARKSIEQIQKELDSH